MKALSFLQPRAEQVISGVKTLDVRTWQVSYRGPLAVHAGATRRAARIRALGFDPETLAYGAVVGVVDLVEIVPLDAEQYAARRGEHLSDEPFPGPPCYGWRLAHPRRLPVPLPWPGKMSLFSVPDDRLQLGPAPAGSEQPMPFDRREPPVEPRRPMRQHPLPYQVAGEPVPDPGRPFVLYTLPDGDGYRVALYQWLRREEPSAGGRNGDAKGYGLAPGALWGVEVGGETLRAVTEPLLAALRANGYKAVDLARRRHTPFYLDEPSGLRLALLLLAVRPLNRYARIEAIAHGVQAMSNEEAYYWFSKCSAGATAGRAQRALRLLLSDE